MATINPQAMVADSMQGGFSDAVFDAQLVFHRVMNAMARPGTIAQIPALACAPAPICAPAASLIAALCDSDTALYLEPMLTENRAITDWTAFHTGCVIVDHPADCMFALITDLAAFRDLSPYAKGTQEYPDRSSTIIIQISSFEEGETYTLSGPGIETITKVKIANLPLFFLDQWQTNRDHYPRGVDIIFVTENALMCLPRTTQMSRGDA